MTTTTIKKALVLSLIAMSLQVGCSQMATVEWTRKCPNCHHCPTKVIDGTMPVAFVQFITPTQRHLRLFISNVASQFIYFDLKATKSTSPMAAQTILDGEEWYQISTLPIQKGEKATIQTSFAGKIVEKQTIYYADRDKGFSVFVAAGHLLDIYILPN